MRSAEDAVEAVDGDITIRATVTVDGEEIHIDFAGTGPQDAHNLNCPLAVTKSACYFVVRCLTEPDLPASGGALAPVTVTAPEGCLVNARKPARGRRGQHEDVHVAMSNTLITPVEALELSYPLRVERWELRRGSGGKGAHTGGDGVVRELRVLEDCRLSLLAERRRRGPRGAAGGAAGAPGRTLVNAEEQEPKVTRALRAGDLVRIETPAGGGFKAPATK